MGAHCRAVILACNAAGRGMRESPQRCRLGVSTMREAQEPNPARPAETGPPDKWLRVLSISARAGEVFANRDKALEWLQTPSPALHGATPLHAIETESGLQEVEDILGRIEYGVLG